MAVGDIIPKRLAGPTVVANTNTVILTVASAKRQNVKQIIVSNTTAIESWITVAIGTSATAGNALLYQFPIVSHDTVVLDTAFTIVAAETIQAISQAGAINITVTGWEEDV